MKKNIIIGISFFAFTLSGCSKSEEGKCKDKSKYWHESTKECKDEAPEGEVVVAPVAETEESCKAKAGYMWNKSNSQCKKLNYFMLIRPEDSDLQGVYVALKRENHARLNEQVYLAKGKCAKIPESYLSNLLVKVKTGYFSAAWDEICSNLAGSEKKCELGVYEVRLVDDNVNFQAVALDAERTDCQLLEKAD